MKKIQLRYFHRIQPRAEKGLNLSWQNRKSQAIRPFAVSAMLMVLILLSPLARVDADQRPGSELPSVSYSSSPQKLVLQFTEIWPEFAEQDRTPLVRVYGDGTVLVHHPWYMKGAGKYQTKLPADELNNLLSQAAQALVGFDANTIKELKTQALQQQFLSGPGEPVKVFFHTADAEISRYFLDIDSMKVADGASAPVSMQPTTVEWAGVQYDAERTPSVRQLQDMKRLEDRLRNLTSSNALEKIGEVTP